MVLNPGDSSLLAEVILLQMATTNALESEAPADHVLALMWKDNPFCLDL